MTPVPPDKRDGYRSAVDRAVTAFGSDREWTVQQVNKACRLAYRVCWTESTWRNLANKSVPESILIVPNDGYGADKDSTGLYQQRESQGWGSVLGSMDPFTATWRFLTAMLDVAPSWFTSDEARVCQQVQRSEYDGQIHDGVLLVYAANYRSYEDVTNALALDRLYWTHKGA